MGDKFLLDANLEKKGEGDQTKVGIDYKGFYLPMLFLAISLLLDDGRVQLKVALKSKA